MNERNWRRFIDFSINFKLYSEAPKLTQDLPVLKDILWYGRSLKENMIKYRD